MSSSAGVQQALGGGNVHWTFDDMSVSRRPRPEQRSLSACSGSRVELDLGLSRTLVVDWPGTFRNTLEMVDCRTVPAALRSAAAS